MNYKLGKSSINNLSGCDKQLQILAYFAIQSSPIDFGISWGHRTPEQQFELFKQGRELKDGKWIVINDRKIVTNCDGYDKISDHNYKPSKAFDYFAYENGKANWNEKTMIIIGEHIMNTAKKLKLVNKLKVEIKWGRYYKNFIDLPHIYLI